MTERSGNIKLLDLFSGIGGFSLAFKRVFPEGEIIGFSEIDKYAIQIYEKHFEGVKNYGSVDAIQTEDLPDFDICTFGFPCQDLSIAGKRKGLAGERSGLFYQAIRIINAKRPKYFIFENVKGLFSSGQGEDFIEVLQAITDIGYNGQWQLLNTKWFLPQNRERIYFVGHLREEPRPKIFPIEEDGAVSNETSRADQTQPQTEISPCLKGDEMKADDVFIVENSLKQIGALGKDSEATRIYDINGIARTIKNGGGLGAKTGLYAVKGDLLNSRIRRLTPMECERLQGFPDGWTEGLSDTQRYKTLGNAITVKVAEEIFKRLNDRP